MPLEDFYCGDEDFSELIAAIAPIIEPSRSQWADWPRLVEGCGGDDELARGVFYVADNNSLEWMHERPPILEGLSATECLASIAGRKRLKEAILRYGGMG